MMKNMVLMMALMSISWASEDIAKTIFNKIPVLQQDIDRAAGNLPAPQEDITGQKQVIPL